jgi:uncharacterized protein YxjI
MMSDCTLGYGDRRHAVPAEAPHRRTTQTSLQTMTADKYTIRGLTLSDDHYTVEQNLARNKYKALDDDGNTVLQAKQKAFKLKEEFPFRNGAGDEVFSINAQQIRDYEGQYVLTEAGTGEDVVVLDHEYSLLEQATGVTWKIRDAETETVLAEITSRKFVGLFRTGLLGNLIPHKYTITDGDGTQVGTISGRLSMKDRYDVEMTETESVPREPVVAAAMVIDAIEGN